MLSHLWGQAEVPREHRDNFLHLYLDIGWFGVLSGSAVNFLSLYVTRLGGTGLQIGLIAAMSSVVSLLLAIPSARWLEGRATGRATFLTSVCYRLGFLLWIPLPWLLSDSAQIWALVAITFIMAIPLTALGVGFNALFAEAVPPDWRAHVAAERNLTLAVTFMLSTLVSGLILKTVPFPAGYQIVFAIGAVGAAMSSAQIYYIRPLAVTARTPATSAKIPRRPWARPNQGEASKKRGGIWQTHFRAVLLVLLGFHLAQYIAIPIFPLYAVRVLGLNDAQIGLGTTLFYSTVLIGSTRFRALVQHLGHRNVTGWGVVGMGLYPLLLSGTTQVWQFLGISFLGGFAWAMAGGAFANYMLEHIPADNRPVHLAWYNIVLHAAILSGSILGPLIADRIGLAHALATFGVLRFLAGFAILRWG
jgi:MFS family permease